MKNISVSQKLLSMLLAGTLSFSLIGCGKYKVQYIPFQDIFYDDNMDGFDDVFENQISDGDIQISNIIKLERCMNLISQLMTINYRSIGYPVISKDEVFDHYKDISFEQLDLIQDQLNTFQEMKNDSEFKNSTDALELKNELYHELVYLSNYVKYNGRTTLYHFGNRLYDSILLGTCGYVGNENNVEAKVGAYIGGGSPTKDYARYSYQEQSDLIDIRNSQFYDLVCEVGKYQDDVTPSDSISLYLAYSTDFRSEIQDMLDEYRHSIDVYKESVVTSYQVEPYQAGIFDDVSYDMKLTSGEMDTSRIIR